MLLLRSVDRLADLLQQSFELFHRSLHARNVLGLDLLLQLGDGRFDLALDLRRNLVGVLLELLLGLIDHRIGVVLRLDLVLRRLVVLGVRLGFVDHAVDFGLGETA